MGESALALLQGPERVFRLAGLDLCGGQGIVSENVVRITDDSPFREGTRRPAALEPSEFVTSLPTGTRLVARLESAERTGFLFPFIFNNPLSFHQHNGEDRLTIVFSST